MSRRGQNTTSTREGRTMRISIKSRTKARRRREGASGIIRAIKGNGTRIGIGPNSLATSGTSSHLVNSCSGAW
jgi:hypothetical protein